MIRVCDDACLWIDICLYYLVGFTLLTDALDIVDPEMREEFEKQRAGGMMGKAAGGTGSGGNNNNQGNAASQGFDLAGWMAGTSPGFLDQARSTAQENIAAQNRRRG